LLSSPGEKLKRTPFESGRFNDGMVREHLTWRGCPKARSDLPQVVSESQRGAQCGLGNFTRDPAFFFSAA